MTRVLSKPAKPEAPKAPSKGLLLYWRRARSEMSLLAPMPKSKRRGLLQFFRMARASHREV